MLVLLHLSWTNLSQVTLTAKDIEAASLQSLHLEGCSGSVTFGALPALRKLELTGRHLPVPDSVARLTALQKLVRVACSLNPAATNLYWQRSF